MHSYDPEKAARVWQRVHTNKPQPTEPDDLTDLISQVQSDANIYLQLSRKMKNQEGTTLKKLSEMKRSHFRCLKGICSLTAGHVPDPAALQTPTESILPVLRRCCVSELHTLSRYELHTAHQDFGCVFTELVREQRMCCRLLTELIGSLH